MLPSRSTLAQIPQRIFSIPNKRKESKRKENYSLFLLCYEAGLRISEAINFDLNAKSKHGLYRLNKTKGKKERYVYIPKEVISELKKHHWKPNHTNRFNFYHFLRKIKRELGISRNIELTPHTLRRAFATYHAEAGLPLPLLQKLLGHKSIRTTALYWMNIYNEDGDDANDVIAGRFWLESPKPPQTEPITPIKANLEELPELMEILPQPLASEPRPEYLSKIRQLEERLNQIQNKKDEKIKELTAEKETLQTDLAELSKQNTNLQQNLAEKEQIIKQLEQKLTAEQEKRTIAESNFAQERKISAEQKQINNRLEQQSQAEREINSNLTQKLHAYEQNHSNLINIYQIALKDKQTIELSAEREKQKADYYEQQLKSIVQTLYQWQKLNYYQQLEQQNKTEAKIIQVERPPPWK